MTSLLGLLLVAGAGLPTRGLGQREVGVDPALYQALKYRMIGPYRGGRSTDASYEVFQELEVRLDTQLARLQEVIEIDIAAFNEMAAQRAFPRIVTLDGR